MKHSESLTYRLRQYFRANPHEILTFADIAAKFDTTTERARVACMHLREEGTVVTMHVAMANPERKRA